VRAGPRAPHVGSPNATVSLRQVVEKRRQLWRRESHKNKAPYRRARAGCRWEAHERAALCAVGRDVQGSRRVGGVAATSQCSNASW